MKKFLTGVAFATVVLAGCQKSDSTQITPNNDQARVAGGSKRTCKTAQIMQAMMAADPTLRQRRADMEAALQRTLSSPDAARVLPDGTIEISVVVNVLYRTQQENISNTQIRSQIDVLNEDFSGTNADYNLVPSLFRGVRSGNIGVRFRLDRVVRKATTRKSWPDNDNMKRENKGGIAATSPSTKLNIWVCNLGDGLLGFAYLPGSISAALDGVVVTTNAFGRVGFLRAPFDRGRTATHEVGHWLNLEHIWGDERCGNDFVGDTPLHTEDNAGCPKFPSRSRCSGSPVMMTMNYMDYTDDACMYMFSAGQKNRMKAALAGPRSSYRLN
jgi:hypothetical protein